MTDKTRVAIFVPSLVGGGAEKSMVNLSEGLIELGFSVDLVMAKAKGPYLSQVPKTVRTIDLNAPHPMLSLPGLVRYLKQERPAAVVSALNQANVVAVWAKRLSKLPIPVTISIRNHLSIEARNGETLTLKMMPHFIRAFYPWADAIVAVSAGVADDLAQMTTIPRERIDVIYNPIVSNELLEKAQLPVEHPWFEKGQTPVILSVGRLHPQKDQTMLLRAFAQVRTRRPARLVILGEGEKRTELETLAQELGITDDLLMPGFQENPYAYMSKASVVALSSVFEGLPGVLIQALACGTPVVSTDCPSGPHEILAGGKYGTLTPVGDADAFADALDNVLKRQETEGKVAPPRESWSRYMIREAAAEYAAAMQVALPEPTLIGMREEAVRR